MPNERSTLQYLFRITDTILVGYVRYKKEQEIILVEDLKIIALEN